MTPKKPLSAKEQLLQMHLARLDTLPLTKEAKDRMAAMLKANQGDAPTEGLDFALKHLAKDRLAIVTTTAKEMHAIGRTIVRRGRASLEAMSETEWQALVNKANE